MKIVPAVLADDAKDFERKLSIATPLSNEVQVDIATSDFVDSSSLNIDEVLAIIAKTKLNVSYHLMTRDIARHIDRIASQPYHRIIVHAEAEPDYDRFYKMVDKDKRGLAINPETSVDKVAAELDSFGELLILTVHPGHSGGQFIAEAVGKITNAKRLEPHLTVSADGGINENNISKLITAGCDIAYIGSALLETENPKEYYDKLKSLSSG